MTRAIGAFTFLLALGIAGCSGGNREAIMKDALAVIDEMATVMENAKNADEAKPKLESLLSKLKDLKKKEDAMGRPTKAEEEALKKKFDPELAKIQKRIQSATIALTTKDPQGMQRLLPIFNEMASWEKK